MQERLNLILIDHQHFFRKGLSDTLETDPTFNVLADSDNVSILSPLLHTEKIDMILVDVKMMKENLSQIKLHLTEENDTKIIALTSQEYSNNITDTIHTGIHGCLLKEMNKYHFIDAMKQVYNGLLYIHPLLTTDLVISYRNLICKNEQNRESEHLKHNYTERESEILQLLTDGQSNKAIAQLLDISDKTVKNHVSNILRKMNVRDRTEAVVTAIKNEWVQI